MEYNKCFADSVRVGDSVILDRAFSGHETVHTITVIDRCSRCEGGVLVCVDPPPAGSSGHGFSINWFRPAE